MKEFLRKRPRASNGAVKTNSSGTAVEKKFGVGITANGEIVTTTSKPSNAVYRGGIALDPVTGAMYVTDAAVGATAIRARGLAVTDGALHVDSTGSGFSSEGRISVSGTAASVAAIGLEGSTDDLLMETGDVLLAEGGSEVDISAMNAAAALTGTERIPVVQDSATVYMTATQLRTYVNG
jgi:hypothetical protein